jgi:hypothetical protein
MKTNLKSFALGASLTLGLLGVYALAVSIPNFFTAGDVISAAKMNANFEAMKTAIDALEAKVATLETKTASLESFRTGLASAKGSIRAFAVVNGVASPSTIVNQFTSDGATITLSRTAVGRYRLTIPGESIFIQSDPVVLTGVGDAVCGYSSVFGDLLVECRNLAGTDVDTVFIAVVFND